MPKPRSKDQTAVSISLSKGLLAEIDARAKALGLARSQYLAQIARDNIDKGGPLVIPAADATQLPRIVDRKAEVIEFLKIALTEFESCQNQKSAVPEPPEPLAETELWLRFVDELDEISRHKWIESQKAGNDIGAERAIREWLQKHHALWAAAQEPLTE
jgi:hypothetical protein